MHTIQTAITIDAAPEVIWNILCKGSEFSEWNPFLTSLEGEFRPGGRLKVCMHSPLGGTQEFRPLVIDYRPNNCLRWRGHLLFKGLFDGEHSFQLKQQSDGACVLLHEEEFCGVLAGLFMRRFAQQLTAQFTAMNKALKQRAEFEQAARSAPLPAPGVAA